MDWLTATYDIAADEATAHARAEALALEQSVECPLEAIGDARVLDEIVARVADVRDAGGGRFHVDVRIAAQTTGGEPAQLMNMVFGNCSLWPDVRLRDLQLPESLAERFAGPRHGLRGIRDLLGAPHRALTNAAVKPQGLHVPELARLCETFARAGVDIVKDDHGIADQAYSPAAQRIPACAAAVARASRETGRPSLYAPHVGGSPRAMRDRLRIARESGVRVVMIAPMLVGLPAFADVVDEFPEFVYLAHPSSAGSLVAPSLLFGHIYRLLGADAVIFVNYGGRFAYPQAECGALADALRAPWYGFEAALPVPAGGMRVERVDELLDFYGTDTMLLIGGNLLVARDDLFARTCDFVRRVEAYGAAATA